MYYDALTIPIYVKKAKLLKPGDTAWYTDEYGPRYISRIKTVEHKDGKVKVVSHVMQGKTLLRVLRTVLNPEDDLHMLNMDADTVRIEKPYVYVDSVNREIVFPRTKPRF